MNTNSMITRICLGMTRLTQKRRLTRRPSWLGSGRQLPRGCMMQKLFRDRDDYWRKESGRCVAVKNHGNDIMSYGLIKFGTEFSLQFSAKTRECFGQVISRTDTEICFSPLKANEARKMLSS